MIKTDGSFIKKFINEEMTASLTAELSVVDKLIKTNTGKGNDFTGWLNHPEKYDRAEHLQIKKAADKIRGNSDVFIVIGIGGSYLGAKAALDFIKTPYYNSFKKTTPDIYFLGNSFSGEELENVLNLCEGKRVSINVISKSGTTAEPAIAFRFVREYLEKRYTSEELKERIYVTTDSSKGALLGFAKKNGYECFVIPDDIGGRFSVMTAVGLLPLAVAGCDTGKILKGALKMKNEIYSQEIENQAYRYAIYRTALLRSGKNVEVLVSYDPYLRSFGEWWKQLFGESEGKDGKGIYPSSAIFSTDLHSMGQYIQEGQRFLFETVLVQNKEKSSLTVKRDTENLDGLNYLAGKTMNEINEKAMMGTLIAHTDGKAPNILINFEDKSEETFGALCYFFFIACAASAYLLDVNPFDQPGVEEYKKNMFALLGRPGSEELTEKLIQKIKSIK